ncbi:non-ribosomal peptide synthetase, partial [Pyxidicoccus xibeiensis]|uniref:non-ribosomal peptide synthetase n=1 Tax=Pyxidicoccus xibeiensis TaxID=2906759 RepID=UPI0020A7326D
MSNDLYKRLQSLPPEKREQLLRQLRKEAPNTVRTAIARVPRTGGPLPTSFAQQRLWFLDQLEPGSAAYNVPTVVRLRGRMDAAVLERSLGLLVERHEALRTRFHVEEGVPVQVIAPTADVPLTRVDISAVPEASREDEAKRLAREEIRRPFNLAQGPLLRATLLRLGDTDHVLLMTMHHIVTDGWSMGVLLRELVMLYATLGAGKTPVLPELSVQYADHAAWQRERLSGEALEKELGWWRERLAGAPAVLELPTDRPRPAVQTYRGTQRLLPFSKELWESFSALCQREGVTRFMALMAAFQSLLARYTGQDEICVGVPIAGRTRSELEGVVGYFVNTLVIRTRLDGNPTFRELLARVKEAAVGAFAHQELPFERLVEALQPERSMSHPPLFQVMLVHQEGTTQPMEIPGLRLESLESDLGVAKFDWTLTVQDTPGGFAGALEYNTDLFEPETIDRALGHLRMLMEAATANPEQRLHDLPLLTSGERHRLVAEWNATRTEQGAPACVHHLMEAQAARTPDAVALVYEEQALTYRELDARANQLAWHLRALGVGPETRVGVCLERSVELVVSLLAVLKAGGAYVPFDPGYPRERLAAMLEDAAPRVLLTQESLRERLPPNDVPAVILDAEAARLAALPATPPPSGVGPEHLAYVIFTSGSTGRPKGAMNAHAAVVNRLRWMQAAYGLDGTDSVLQKTPFSFDVSVWEFFWPLMTGARLVVARPGGHQDTTYLSRLIQSQGITTLHFVPSMLAAFLEEPELEERCRAVRRIVCSGEALPVDVAERCLERLGAELHNLYGPTEAAVDVTAWQCRRGDNRRSIPIGRPIANTRIHLLDRALRPVPVGVAGELYIGGVQVGRGYLGRPELTAERFVPDAFSETPGARLYRTGDLARYLPDGAIEYLGRVDFQVKVRGFRIELGEIEAVLGQHPAVREAVVVARESGGDRTLVAYVSARQEQVLDVGALRELARARLPEYMVPPHIVVLDTLPLTPSGKVDRRALPAPEATAAVAARVYEPPRTPVEELLAGAFARALKLERVGLHEDFFELGGHSLLATQVVSRIRGALQVELSLRDFFAARTVAALAARVEAASQAVAEGTAPPPLVPVPRGDDLPLSFAQQRLWFIDQLEPGNSAYNIPLALRLDGPLDVDVLERAFAELVRRHESLRTTFQVRGERAAQCIASEARFTLRRVDLSAQPDEAREETLHRLAREETLTPFSLSQGPLLRATVLHLGERQAALLVTMHHIVSDGWSLGVLAREMSVLYEAFLKGTLSPLPELAVQYADFSAWQRGWLQGDVLEAQLSWWRKQLADAPRALELPTDFPRPAVQTSRGSSVGTTFAPALTKALKELCQREGVTPFMVLLAATQALLARYSGQEDIVVGSPIAGRNRAETEGLIGFFVNTLVLRGQPRRHLSFRELLHRAREVTLGAYAHQEVPFEKLVEELQPERDLSRTPLFQVMVVLQNNEAPALDLPGLTSRPVALGHTASKFDLTLYFAETPQGLGAVAEYSADLFEPATLQRLLGHLGMLLQGALADPSQRLSRLPLLSEPERRQLLVDWTATRQDFRERDCFQVLFEEQAERTPDVIAVRYQDVALSYRELNLRANRLAHYLMDKGVGPETVVALLAERGSDFLVSMLGIFKAGGAYVPLDPKHPPHRISQVMGQSGASLALCGRELLPLLATSPSAEGHTYVLEEALAAVAPEVNPPPRATPANLAYVIFTSGSTGLPKGAMVEHRGMLNHLYAKVKDLGLTSSDVVAQTASQCFDISVWQFLNALVVGGCTHVFGDEVAHDPALLTRALEEHAITIVETVPSLLRAMVEGVEAPDAWRPKLARLRWMVPTGEALPPAVCRRWFALWPEIPLLNAYGPTECSDDVTHHPMRATPTTVNTPIGRAVANMRLHLLDAEGQPVPVGVPGEVYVGGIGVGRGYLMDAVRTAEVFLPDVFSDVPGARMYRTGDLARWLPGGDIEFLGRVDFQVKVRGFRIELGEIESALLAYPDVREAVVVAREDVPGQKRLVAYVSAKPGHTLEVARVRTALKEKLPEYMVPAAFVVLEALPLTSNGKVDRKALPAPEAATEEARPYTAPRDDVEAALADIWARVLGRERVGIHDNFFDLGGDSIVSIQVVTRARQAGLRLTPRQLFQHQTVAELAPQVKTARQGHDEQGFVEGPVPLTPVQRAFFEEASAEPQHFNQSVMLEALEPVDATALEQALQKLVEHHDALRLRFVREGGEWRQDAVAPGQPVRLRRVDLSGVPEAELAAAVTRAADEVQRSLDLSEGLLLRAALLERGAGRTQRVLVVLHHLSVDGVSWRVLLEDLESAYRQLRRGEPVTLPPKTTSYKAWAEWLQAHARSEAVEAELPHWLQAARAQVAPLPVDIKEGANTVASERSVQVSLSAEETRLLLQETPGAYRAHIDDVLLAALGRAVAEWTGGTRVRVEQELHGREVPSDEVDVSRTVGWFTATWPLLLEVSRGGSPGDTLRNVRESRRQRPGSGLGHGLLRHLGRPEAAEALRAQPRPGILFNYLGQLDALAQASQLFRPAPESQGSAQSGLAVRSHLLEVDALVAGGQLRVSWKYSEGVHQHATVESVAQGFVEALRALIRGRDSADARHYLPSDFPLARLEAPTLARVLEGDITVEDLYPLSPMQQGMLFHALLTPGRDDYFEQVTWVFQTPLELGAFRRAWEALLERHTSLRTSFIWKGLASPLQRVHTRVELPWTQQDWRDLTHAQQQSRLDAFLEEDKAKGFDLTRPPLMRMAVMRLDEQAHQFVWSLHHLLMDGWSLGVLMRELFALYDAFSRGQAPRTERATPYREYIAWLQRQDLAGAEAFWRPALEGFTAPTPLPGGKATVRVEHGVAQPVERRFDVPTPTMAALQGFARQHQLTLNTLVQASWAVLLARHSGEQDVVFGTTVAGRPTDLPGVEQMLGQFINSLPMRVRLPPDAALVPWLKQLQENNLEMRQYEYSPLVQVQGWSQVPRGTPLFESLLVFENFPVDASVKDQAGAAVRDVRFLERKTFPMDVTIAPGPTLRIVFTYDAARFESAACERLLGQWLHLLESLPASAGVKVGELSLLSAAERRQVLVEWNDTHADFPRDACAHELFSAQAARTPEATAVSFEGQALTYAELERRSNQLAWHLRSLGVGPETRVGVCMERSLELVVGALGILKAGGVYVPLDPSYPMDRLGYMARDAAVPVLLTQEALADVLPSQGELMVCLDTEWAQVATRPEHAPPSVVTADNLAYVIYTSGSTGRPKGTLLAHRGLCNTALAAVKAHGFRPDSRVLQFAAIGFDASVCEMFATLLAGARLCLAPREAMLPGTSLAAVLREQRITAVTLTPSVLALQSEEGLPDLETVISAGEACTPELASRWGRGRTLLNAYGPTEVTVCATITPGSVAPERLTIGRPFPNVRLYVLDATLRPVPVGAPGELFVGGPGLARGYLGQPGLTAERFVPDAFGSEPGARLYRTGDRVRFLADGQLEYQGRLDEQVKLRGFRIETGEIESVLRQQPAVREATVVVREDVPGDKRLVAYVVAEEGLEAAVEPLRKALEAVLPGYMVPSAFVTLPALPLSPSGKVDRKALPAPEGARSTEREFVPPATPMEELVAGIWADVLHVPRVGRHDDFFELGGHSLMATQVAARVRAVLGVELPVRDLFDASTVEKLVARLQTAAKVEHAAPELVPVPRAADGMPLSFAQQRLWFLHQLDPRSSSYHLSLPVRLEGALDAAVLRRSLDALVARHETLRTTFVDRGGEPAQVIAPAAPVVLEEWDLSGLPSEAREAEALRRAEVEAGRPFDLERGPLVRPVLVRLDAKDHVLLVTMHHIITDGWSLGVLVREVAALYEAFLEGRPSPLPELPVQYADFASWQRGWLRGDALEAQLGWWRNQLGGVPHALELPTDRPRPAVQGFRGASLEVRLPKELSDAVLALCQREGATPFMALLAAFHVLLWRYSGQRDFAIGTPIAGRGRAETEGLIGFFVNTLALGLRPEPRMGFKALLARAREVTLGAYAHQDVPFEKLVDALQPARDLGRSPLFQVMLLMQNAPVPQVGMGGLVLRSFEVPNRAAKFDLSLSLAETPSGIAGTFDYSTDLFDEETVARMAGHLRTLLEAAVAAPDAPVVELGLMPEPERRQVLREWNDTAAPYPSEATVHGLFEEQVTLRPDAVALEATTGERLTYRELEARANRLAWLLRERGVGPDVRVGLCLERSVDLIVTVLAILKAGGAYVPLDSNYPRARLSTMLEDSRPRVLVTTRALLELLPAEGVECLLLDEAAEALALAPTTAPRSGATSRHLAYIDFTSGSTGRPKGVCIEHRSVARLVRGVDYADLGASQTFLLIAPISFDASTLEVWGCLLNGGRLVLYPPHAPNDVRELAGVLEQHGVTTLHLTAGLFTQMVEADLEALRPVRQLLTGGDVVSAPHVRRVLETLRIPVTACYGPTESTTFASCFRMTEPAMVGSAVPIGRPIGNTRVYLLDGSGQPVPAGVAGELYIGGDGLARGYLEQPDLTAERFVPDAFGGEPGERLYRTGDLARWRRDGVLEFLGRMDVQVKVRGYRVEPGEVEAALLGHPEVREAVVVARPDAAGGKRLVAYVAGGVEVGAVRDWLRERLPEYMVPSAFMLLEALPLTPNGKVDRGALPEPEQQRAQGNGRFSVAPSAGCMQGWRAWRTCFIPPPPAPL